MVVWLVNVKNDARMIENVKNFFTDSDMGAEWAKLWVKSIKTLLEFVAKLRNLDNKVHWSFLSLIAKNKLDEKGTLSLISNGVPFLMNSVPIILTVFFSFFFFFFFDLVYDCQAVYQQTSKLKHRLFDQHQYLEKYICNLFLLIFELLG